MSPSSQSMPMTFPSNQQSVLRSWSIGGTSLFGFPTSAPPTGILVACLRAPVPSARIHVAQQGIALGIDTKHNLPRAPSVFVEMNTQ